MDDDVGIDEHQQVAGGSTGTTISRYRRTLRPVDREQDGVGLPDNFNWIFQRSVTDNNELMKLPSRAQALAGSAQRSQTPPQLSQITVKGDNS